jgi:hypothetical protein
MLLRPATRNCSRNIGLLFRIAAAKFQDAKFRALSHSGSGNGSLPLLRVQLRPLLPLFITLAKLLFLIMLLAPHFDISSSMIGNFCRNMHFQKINGYLQSV